jgi:predicted AlkP superfamily phosphohydrolase/phosphomutase
MTAPSWTSIVSGVNPAKHGIFDFVIHDHSTKETRLATALDVMRPRLHEILSMSGLRTVVINLPLSFPFTKFKGAAISDWLTPHLSFYPDETAQIASEYVYPVVGPLGRQIQEDIFSKSLLEETRGRVKGIMSLFSNTNWDCFYVLFSEPDWIFHKAYSKIISSENPSRVYDQIFSLIDNFVGFVVRSIGRKDALLIVSDHGFAAYDKLIVVNRILAKAGLTRSKLVEVNPASQGDQTRVEQLSSKRFKVPKTMSLLAKKFPLLASLGVRAIERLKLYPELQWIDEVDCNSSKAYSLTDSGFGVHVKPDWEVPTINALRSEINPETGQPVFHNVYKNDEIYSGPYLDRAPRIIYVPDFKAGYWAVHKDRGLVLGHDTIIQRPSNEHSMRGVFIGHSELFDGIEDETEISVYDFLPTVLDFLDVAIPSDCDGKSIISQSASIPSCDPSGKYDLRWRIMRSYQLQKIQVQK